jgi:hypothetical protein
MLVLAVFFGVVRSILPFEGQEQIDEELYPKSSLSLLRVLGVVQKVWKMFVIKIASLVIMPLKLGIQVVLGQYPGVISPSLAILGVCVVICAFGLSTVAGVYFWNIFYRRRRKREKD